MSLGDNGYKLPAAIAAVDGGEGTTSSISISQSAGMVVELSAAGAGLTERRWKSSDLDRSRHSLRRREGDEHGLGERREERGIGGMGPGGGEASDLRWSAG